MTTPVTPDDMPLLVLSVRDIDASRHFYGDILGLHMVFRHNDRTSFQVGSTHILLHPGRGDFEGDPPDKIGWGVAIYFTVQDVDGAIQYLRGHGVPVIQDPTDQPWGERDATVLDPDGY